MKICIEISGNKDLIPNINKENFNLLIKSFHLQSHITIVNSKLATVKFKIMAVKDKIEVKCQPFNKNTKLNIDSTIEDVFGHILYLLGYFKASVTNITVKDQFGLKIKPVIEVFAKKTLCFELPKELEYVKPKDIKNSPSNTTQTPLREENFDMAQIFFNNEVLTSLLSATDLDLMSNNKKYKLKCLSGLYYISYTPNESPSLATDYLTDYTILNEFRKCTKINKNYSEFKIFLLNSTEVKTIDKNKFSKFFLNKNVPSDLKNFLENVPRYQDERDEIVQYLVEYYNTNTKGYMNKKGDYLNIEINENVEYKNKNSLASFRKK